MDDSARTTKNPRPQRRSITVNVEPTHLADVELALVGDRVQCVSLRIRGYALDEQEQSDYRHLDLPLRESGGREITASLVRRVRVGALIKKAIDRTFLDNVWADAILRWDEESNPVAASLRPWARRTQDEVGWIAETSPPPTKVGRPPIPDEMLMEVAAIYSEAHLEGRHDPSQAVSQRLSGRVPGMSPTKARNWVYQARKRGFLKVEPRRGRRKTEEP